MNENKCSFSRAWIGKCNESVVPGTDRCEKHTNVLCESCGKPATHECMETMIEWVCGVPLCDNCEHELTEDGTTGSQMKHCKKEDQKYIPWYMR